MNGNRKRGFVKCSGARLIFVVCAMLAIPFSALADVAYDAERRFQEVLSLWSDGRYEDLWECGTDSSKAGVSREDFVWTMKRSPRMPDVGWLREKSVTATVKKPTRVSIQAEINFIINGEDRLETRVFQMTYEDDEWRILLSEFVRLARPLEYGY
jgi:hypothetical protein